MNAKAFPEDDNEQLIAKNDKKRGPKYLFTVSCFKGVTIQYLY